jgi:hypothetical protein
MSVEDLNYRYNCLHPEDLKILLNNELTRGPAGEEIADRDAKISAIRKALARHKPETPESAFAEWFSGCLLASSIPSIPDGTASDKVQTIRQVCEAAWLGALEWKEKHPR